MIAARWVLLLLSTAAAAAAMGVGAAELAPSAARLIVACVAALLAPLFWPGTSGSKAHPALRVVLWSLAVAALAGLVMRALGGAAQAALPILRTLAMLLPILLLTHAAAGLGEQLLRRRGVDAARSRDAAGRSAVLALAGAAALPVWLGPSAELLSARHESLVDTVVAASPLTHLALASGNDLLRNAWLYEHSNLAALAVSYPDLRWTALGYALAVALLLACLALRPGRGRLGKLPMDPPMETQS